MYGNERRGATELFKKVSVCALAIKRRETEKEVEGEEEEEEREGTLQNITEGEEEDEEREEVEEEGRGETIISSLKQQDREGEKETP